MTNTYGKTQSIRESRESDLYLGFQYGYLNNVLLLTNRKEKEKQVIKLAEEGKTTREIAKEVHVSLKDIGKIIRKETGDDNNEAAEKDNEKEKAKEKQKRLKSLSSYAQAFQMFKDKLSLADVVIELDIDTGIVLNYYEDYLILVRTYNFMTIYDELKYDLPIFIHLYKRIKKEGLSKQDITDLLQNQQRLRDMEKRVGLYNDFIRSQELQVGQI
jgi:transposase